MSIKSRKSIAVRNIVRGIISNDSQRDVIRARDKIKKNYGYLEYEQFSDEVRNGGLYSDVPIAKYFDTTLHRNRLDDYDFRGYYIVSKIDSNKDKIISLIRKMKDIYAFISRGDAYDFVGACSQFRKDGGASVFLLKILHLYRYIHDQNDEDGNDIDRIDSELESLGVRNVEYISDAIKSLVNSRIDYFNISEKIFISSDSSSEYFIARSFVNQSVLTREDFFSTFSAYFSVSIIDSFLYLMAFSRVGLPYVDELLLEVPDDLKVEYLDLQTTADRIIDFILSHSLDYGVDLFRSAFCVTESLKIYNYWGLHGVYFNGVGDSRYSRIPYFTKQASDYFFEVKSLADISTTVNKSYCLDFYDKRKSGLMENTTALLFMLEQDRGLKSGGEEYFLKLLDSTTEIARLVPSFILSNVEKNSESELISLIALCLKKMKDGGNEDEFKLRRALVEYVEANFEGSLIAFLESIREKASAVSDRFVELLDEVFISKLFTRVSSPNEALELRADILEWHGNKTGDEEALRRARTLKIDVQINKEKGCIDDSRIYVDAGRIISWINRNSLKNITLALDSMDNIEASDIVFDWGKANVGFGVYDQVALELKKDFHEFCTNKLFGIASYLGRRIRHGTFGGTAMKGFDEIVSSEKYKPLFMDRAFNISYQDWFSKYEETVDDLIRNKLHVREKNKPHGLIIPEFDSQRKKKNANKMLEHVINSYLSHGRSETISYIIVDFCWRILEADLTIIKKNLQDSKERIGGFSYKSDSNLNPHLIKSFCKDVNTNIGERYRGISIWFNKPSYALPQADISLLARAVVSEVQSLCPEYEPQYKDTSLSKVTVTGGTYYAIYDALFVLIMNAAQHGIKKGKLLFGADVYELDNTVVISVESEIPTVKELYIRDRISQFMTESVGDAYGNEGGSGIKKIRHLCEEGLVMDLNYAYESGRIKAIFKYPLDYTL